jgi:hypothetical protein
MVLSLIYLNKFESPKGIMVAMCDEDVMGRVLREGRIEINLKQYGGFYKGELMSEEQVKYALKDGSIYSANVVGNRSVGILIELGVVKEDEVRTIEGVRYVHIFRVMK